MKLLSARVSTAQFAEIYSLRLITKGLIERESVQSDIVEAVVRHCILMGI